jgi:hypothetical protein
MNPVLALSLKAIATAIFIVGVSELAKRSNFASALLVGLPLTSVLTVVWLYLDTDNASRAGHYAWSVLLLLPPGCLFLAALPLGIRFGFGFWPSLAAATALTGALYMVYAFALQRIFQVTL